MAEMSDMVKAKRQEISAQHPRELKASPLSLHKKGYKRSAMKKTEWLRAPPGRCSKDPLLTEIHPDAQRRLQKNCSEQYPSLPLLVWPCYRQKFFN